jgi:diguanylate cyclase (GGDEF)-like protein
MTDNLTGLYNLYARKLEIEEQEREYRYDHTDSFYVFSCDLDRFKTINDTWGHAEGDRALSLVAAALTKVAAQFDAKVFRVGGDEFQIIADTSDERVAEQIENALEMEFAAINFRDDFDIKISIGKILYNGEKSTDQLLAEADSRMYAEKNRKKK